MHLRSEFAHTLTVEAPIAVAVFVVVASVVAVALVRGRARAGRNASTRAQHPVLEPAALAVFLCVAVFLVWFDVSHNVAEGAPQGSPALTVKVTGFQWCWRFDYVGKGATVTGTCVHGNDPVLVLPTGRTIRFEVTSEDVIHGFWVPYLRFKTYAMPDHVNTFEVKLDSPGTWPGRCAVFCGLYHAYMDFSVHAVSPSAFSSWLRTHHSIGARSVGRAGAT